MIGTSQVGIDLKRLSQTSWHDYALRFLFGGLITAVAGYLAHQYGPVVGGLFLAFPAILPASVTLIEQHSGKDKAEADARGAVIGSVGLMAFAVVVWGLAGHLAPLLVLGLALAAWLAAAVGLWLALRSRAIVEG